LHLLVNALREKNDDQVSERRHFVRSPGCCAQARRSLNQAHSAALQAWRLTFDGELNRCVLAVIESEMARLTPGDDGGVWFDSAMTAFAGA
jgi:hypothetical protein